MKTKTIIILSLFIIFFGCKSKENNEIEINEKSGIKTKIDKDLLNASDSSVIVADSIMYITNVINPEPEEDYYMKEWLSGAKTEVLANLIFTAVYNKQLKPYNYITGKEMTLAEVEDLEKNWIRENIGQILFTEDWYFDEKELKMYKQVNSIMLAYYTYSDDGLVNGNKAGIRVYLNDTKPMKGAVDY